MPARFGRRIRLAATLLLGAAAPAAAQQLTTDVEMSEWSPPLVLTLDLPTGRYDVVPPASGWPGFKPKPRSRVGVLGPEPLARVRQAFDRAWRTGLADPACVAANAKGYPLMMSNAGVARMTLAAGGRVATTTRHYACWTSAARALHAAAETVVADLPCGQARARSPATCFEAHARPGRATAVR